MKPVKNFRETLNGARIAESGVMYEMKTAYGSATTPTDILWIRPQTAHRYRVYIEFDWVRELWHAYRKHPVVGNQIPQTLPETIGFGRIESEQMQSLPDFYSRFLTPQNPTMGWKRPMGSNRNLNDLTDGH